MKTIYWLVLATTVAMAGCDKAGISGEAKIISDCSLNGRGEYKCTFKNKGTAKGSLCEHIVLDAKPGYRKTFGIVDGGYSDQGHKEVYLLVMQSSRAVAAISAKLDDVGPPESDIRSQTDDYTKRDENLLVNDGVDENAIANIMQEANKSGGDLSKYIAGQRVALAITVYERNRRGLSQTEICSGIVEAGDIREVSGLVLFGSDGLSPVDACHNPYGKQKWTDACSFTTVTVDKLDKLLKAKIESASRK